MGDGHPLPKLLRADGGGAGQAHRLLHGAAAHLELHVRPRLPARRGGAAAQRAMALRRRALGRPAGGPRAQLDGDGPRVLRDARRHRDGPVHAAPADGPGAAVEPCGGHRAGPQRRREGDTAHQRAHQGPRHRGEHPHLPLLLSDGQRAARQVLGLIDPSPLLHPSPLPRALTPAAPLDPCRVLAPGTAASTPPPPPSS